MSRRPVALSSAALRLLSITACAWELRRCRRSKPAMAGSDAVGGVARSLGAGRVEGGRP